VESVCDPQIFATSGHSWPCRYTMESVDVVLVVKLIHINVRIVVHVNMIVNHLIMKVLVVAQNIQVIIVTAQGATVISKKKLFFLFFFSCC